MSFSNYGQFSVLFVLHMTLFGIERRSDCHRWDTSAGLNLSQEMPTSAVNDALITIKKEFFALHIRTCLAELK